jgi:hypothetical protein
MAMQIHTRNRMKSNPENKFEQTSNLWRKFGREFIGGSGGYRALEFAEPISIDEPVAGFPSRALAV